MKSALITGITGQDGSYLAELLASKGYRVYGLIRGQSNPKRDWITTLIPSIELVDGDLTDLSSLVTALEISNPDEVYNLGAISFVGLSWQQAELTGDITGMGVLRLLEAIKIYTRNDMSKIKFYQASSSEMFGAVRQSPQNELTPFHPRSPYGVAKAFGHYITINYRESYGAFAVSGILFNHESPRRGLEFVTRKITDGVAAIALGQQSSLVLGNLDSERDWGFAGDYVEAMWLMMQSEKPDDYVIATGVTHTIRELLDVAFSTAGIADWAKYVTTDPKFVRPADVVHLLGDSEKAHNDLGWQPTKSFEDMITEMVSTDISRRSGNL
jgi:GDPmannose 4,6-dehydratase